MGIGNYSNAGADWLLSYSSFQIIYDVVKLTMQLWLLYLVIGLII